MKRSNSAISGVASTRVARGAYIDFRGGEASSAGDSDAIRVHSGGMINANEATGTLSQTANTLTEAGIIFQQ